MDDSQLIKYAGLAAGIQYSADENPLIDDALALRLAVKLRIDLRINNGASEAVWVDEVRSETHSLEVPCDDAFEGMDAKYAATRRAIVRAAAEVGRTM